jgi:predicted O-methyltransferase YrrM
MCYQAGSGGIHRRYGPVTVSTSNPHRLLLSYALILRKAEARLSQANRLAPIYAHALSTTYFWIARGVFDFDPAQAHLIYQHSLRLSATPESKATFFYRSLYKLVGFERANQLAKYKRIFAQITQERVMFLRLIEKLSYLQRQLLKLPKVYGIYNRLRVLYGIRRNRFAFRVFPGHFYSPISDIKQVKQHYNTLLLDVKQIGGIEINAQQQLELLAAFAGNYHDFQAMIKAPIGGRYSYPNVYFSYGEAAVLFFFLRHFRPKKIIEVGSGFSSALMLDTIERFLESPVHCTFIEPNPERLFEIMNERDYNSHTVIKQPVQSVPRTIFRTLMKNDILFIDSSHVIKAGSDVSYLFNEVLPYLRPGVIVHFHDIMWPFEYPLDWYLRRGWLWNEAYFLRAFLQFNSAFEVLFFNAFLDQFYQPDVQHILPEFTQELGSSLWLRKVG